ncbi:conjugal transfer protein TraF [Myxococcota bacterium]|nr:conjugal transfer protein TraF [Myxococcota bacterium]
MQTKFSIKPCRFGSLFRLCLVFGSLFSPLTLAMATDLPGSSDTGNTFYQDTKHGWFWYEDPPPNIQETNTPEEQATEPLRTIPSLAAYSIEDLWNMHPDDFQGLLNDLQKKAVRHPKEQNILEYLTMQDIARRKALAYTNATMYVTQKYGDLFNVNQVYPTAGPGITARITMQQNEIAGTISQARPNHALLFFINPQCGFCEKQAQILAYFVDKYGWQIKTVDISRQTKAATRFNITVTPTLLLIKKGQGDYMTVATGVIALSELERKLYRTIRYLQGDTRGDTFLMYDFQKGSAFDPTSILNKGKQPWTRTDTD